MAQLAGTPIILLKEGTDRTRGKDAFENNVAASRAVAEAVRTTLGPKGMDKMLVDSLGDVTITNDGATILDEIDVEHPAAKMMVEIAKTQDDKVGDGTTTSVIIGGELLKAAGELVEQSVHPTIVVRGYRKAMLKAKEILDQISEKINLDDRKLLESAAKTAMNSKNIAGAQEYFAGMAVDAITQIKDEIGNETRVNLDYIQIIKKEGKSLKDTEFVRGVIVDKEVVHPLMPKLIKAPKIAVIDTALEIEKTEFDSEIRIQSPDQMQAFLDEEEGMLKRLVDKIVESGANVVFCQKGIDDMAQHFLAKNNIMAIRRVKRSDVEKLARATGAKIVNNVETIEAGDLGSAGLIEERKVGKDKMIFVQECPDPKSVSILVRGGTEHVVNEADRTLHDALCAVKSLFEDPHMVAGGGAAEIEIARQLQDYAATVKGREQLAIEGFASTLESIPITLAENGGFDPVDVLVQLRAAHDKPDGKWFGLDLEKGNPSDMVQQGVIEPRSILLQAIQSATEVSTIILRIDDVIAASHPATSDMPNMPDDSDMDFD